MPKTKRGTTTKLKPKDRRSRVAVKSDATVKAKRAKPVTPAQPNTQPAGASRAEGIRLFKLAGRPTK